MLTGTMAEIIEFPHGREISRRRGKKSAPAQVIIFPGVRIERREFSLGDRLPRAQRKLGRQAAAAELD